MRRTQERLIREISELEVSRDQAKTAVDHVLDLLKKADSRRLSEGDRPWNRILDNLENALDLTRARLTTYEQLLKERRRDLEFILKNEQQQEQESSASGTSIEEQVLIDTLREVLPEDVPIPKNHLLAAERILAMPLDQLGNMTLDEVERMNSQLFEENTAALQCSMVTITKKSWLEERVERAKKARESISLVRRPEATFADRRRQVTLRNAIEKISLGNFKLLDLDEIDMLTKCTQGLESKPQKSDSDLRLISIIDRCTERINERASELRRRRAQSYARKPYPNI
jgi:hypothetical protein